MHPVRYRGPSRGDQREAEHGIANRPFVGLPAVERMIDSSDALDGRQRRAPWNGGRGRRCCGPWRHGGGRSRNRRASLSAWLLNRARGGAGCLRPSCNRPRRRGPRGDWWTVHGHLLILPRAIFLASRLAKNVTKAKVCRHLFDNRQVNRGFGGGVGK